MPETQSNMEAVRGGYAMRRMTLQSTRCYHAVHREGRGDMYLCGCGREIRGVDGFSRLRRNARRDARFADKLWGRSIWVKRT